MRRAAGVFAAMLLAIASPACQDVPPAAPPPLPGPPPLPDAPSARPGASASSPHGPAPSSPPIFVPERISAEARAMGTHIGFAAYTTPKVDAARTRAAFDAAVAEIKRVEALMTTWTSDSEVSRINAAAGKDAVVVGDETFAIIKESLHASEISEGTFDITFQTLHGLWKFDEDLDPHPPTQAQVAARLPFVGWRNVVLDPAKKSVKLTKRETQIGLGGIAKGYGVDRAVKVLDDAGLASFFVQAGGDLFARGKKPDGSEWQAAIRDPRSKEGKYFAKLPLSEHAFSTAGDYERSYIVDGKRYHHIIDPRTGFPATASRSVTIWAPTALVADEIDDAVFILGPKKGLELVESLDGVAAVIVDSSNNLWISKRLQGRLELVAPLDDGL